MTDSSLSVIKRYRPYFTLVEVDEMLRKQSAKLAPARVEAIRQQACVFMDKLGSRLGFPRRTIASGLLLYHRFHLYFPFSEFNFYDVSIASIWLASKLEDTLKKLREIQLAAWVVRNVQEGGNGLGEPEASILDGERHRLSGIERLLLETVCFDFGSGKPLGGRDVFGYLVGFARKLNFSRSLIQLAFRLAIDSHRTLAGLTYPPHLIALACLYLASFIHPDPLEEDSKKFLPNWNLPYEADIDDIEEVCHQMLDLLISLSSTIRSHQSPSSPSEGGKGGGGGGGLKTSGGPSGGGGVNNASMMIPSSTASPIPSATELIQLKIKLRELENQRKTNNTLPDQNHHQKLIAGAAAFLLLDPLNSDSTESSSDGKLWLGRDDVTVRFIFGNPLNSSTSTSPSPSSDLPPPTNDS